MNFRAFKLRFRRRLRVQTKQLEEFGQTAEQGLERNFFRRLERLSDVRRFVAGWLVLLLLLGSCVVAQIYALGDYYLAVQPAPGGTYTEGILGSFTNANPIYATSPVDSAVSRLIFSGLYTYDENNHLIGDLADGAWTTNPRGTVYTVKLKPHLTWQDGQPLTADDVAFTYQVIQSADAQSPLISSWQGIQVAALDPHTVVFTLPSSLVSFPYSLTNGILPKHLLAGTAMVDMRSIAFNTQHPVGSGPFAWQALQLNGESADDRQEQIALKPFAGYQGGKPKLDAFIVRSFRNQSQLVRSFERQELTAIAGLTDVPKALQRSDVKTYNLPLTAAVMTFFKTSVEGLNDSNVRQALVRAIDVNSIIASLGYATTAVKEPLLRTQLGYNPAYTQANYDPLAAASIFDKAGWLLGADHLRHKAGHTLGFKLYAQNNSEYSRIARELSREWRAAGVEAEVVIAPDSASFQTTLAGHAYDALLYGISLGVDPDVFVYWDSSQADPRSANRLNFSEYKSSVADSALEAGRTRIDPGLRSIKYQPFLQAWQMDAPALAMYQPRFLYLTRQMVYGLAEHPINVDTERFTNVQNWEIHTTRARQ